MGGGRGGEEGGVERREGWEEGGVERREEKRRERREVNSRL